MAKFKVGDKVKILDGSYIEGYREIWVSKAMEEYVGRILTISHIISDDNNGVLYKMQDAYFAFDERGLELAEKENNTMKVKNINMPEIVNYTYDKTTGMTKIKWSDKTETTVYTEIGTVPDQFTGFVVAYAKKAAGNTSRINNLFEKWAIKKPIKDKIDEEKRIAQETEEKRIAEKRKVKREKWLIRKEALRIKREYEARKLANEKYGIPLNED